MENFLSSESETTPGVTTAHANRLDAVLKDFRGQLEALTEKNLLPLDNDTIEFCVKAMRREIEEGREEERPG